MRIGQDGGEMRSHGGKRMEASVIGNQHNGGERREVFVILVNILVNRCRVNPSRGRVGMQITI